MLRKRHCAGDFRQRLQRELVRAVTNEGLRGGLSALLHCRLPPT